MYLLTRDEEPFCAHQYIVKIHNSPSALPVVSYGKIQIVLFGQLDINETFTITNKDDAALSVGETMKKIIVPHPALQGFNRVQITYTAYKGWLSNGLSKWSIDKFILTDSYGNSQSVCQRGLVMQSEVSVVLPLYPGDCNLPELMLQINQGVDIGDKVDLQMHGGQPEEYGQQHINDTSAAHISGGGGDVDLTAPGDLAAAAGSAGLSATLGVGIKEYMNVPWMPLVDIEAGPAGNSLDPSPDRREQSGRGFSANGAGRTGNRTATDGGAPAVRPAAESDDQFPYDEVVQATVGRAGAANGTAGEIREPVLRPKSRFRMYRMPDGSPAAVSGVGNGTSSVPTHQNAGNASSATTVDSRSFIVHLLPQKLMNMIEQAERYARMAFSPFMWPTKERAQRALKNFPRFLFNDNKTSEQVVNVQLDESPKRYIPLTFGNDRPDEQAQQSSGRATLIEARIVPAMTDDSPIVEEDLDLSKEDIR
jgi:hypothetical protein